MGMGGSPMGSTTGAVSSHCVNHCQMLMSSVNMFTISSTVFNPWLVVMMKGILQGEPSNAGLCRSALQNMRDSEPSHIQVRTLVKVKENAKNMKIKLNTKIKHRNFIEFCWIRIRDRAELVTR